MQQSNQQNRQNDPSQNAQQADTKDQQKKQQSGELDTQRKNETGSGERTGKLDQASGDDVDENVNVEQRNGQSSTNRNQGDSKDMDRRSQTTNLAANDSDTDRQQQ